VDRTTRNSIERATQKARRVLEDDYAAQLEGTFDVLRDGHIAERAGPHLTPRQAYQRAVIVAALDRKRASGMDAESAVADYLRDAAFTTLNRFVALKLLEARKLLQECVSRGQQSAGYAEFVGMAPGVALLPDNAGYRLYIESLFDELSTEVKVLFERRDPASVLWPRRLAFEVLLEVLNAPDLASVWAQDETLGWVYQFFNSPEERRQMRDASPAPRNNRELAVRNQFFTPRYVVQFLVDNTLGREWLEMLGGGSELIERLEYFVRPANEELATRPPKDPRDIRVLDPACGSGHFLLYSFDLLLEIYEEAWQAGASMPPSHLTGRTLRQDFADLDALRAAVPALVVERNLYGVEIDARCAQIAALALWLRAQRAYQDVGLAAAERPRIRRTHIVIAEPMPGDKELAASFAADLEQPFLRTLFDRMIGEMRLAGELGILLQVDRSLAEDISHARRQFQVQQERPELFPELRPKLEQGRLDLSGVTDDRFFEEVEETIVAGLRRFAESAGGTDAGRRLFAEDAAQGVALIDLVRTRFDVVLMNPPFGEATPATREYLRKCYPDASSDLYLTFVQRASELAPSGWVGCISSRTILVNASSEQIRRRIHSENSQVCAIADLGYGVLDAMVEACAYVFGGLPRSSPSRVSVASLLRNADKGSALLDEITRHRLGQESSVREVDLGELSRVFRFPWAYWLSAGLRTTLVDQPSIEDGFARVRVGLSTADNFRFLRLIWEVPADSFDPSIPNKHWVPLAKGGEYAPLFDDIHLALNWASDGREIDATNGATVRSREEYFRGGTYYPYRTTSALSLRVLPVGAAFADGGPAVLPSDPSPSNVARLLVLYNSRVGRYFAEVFLGEGDAVVSGSAARNYIPRAVGAVPSGEIQRLPGADHPDMAVWLNGLLLPWIEDETSGVFRGIWVPAASSLRLANRLRERRRLEVAANAVAAAGRIESMVEDALHVSNTDRDVLDEAMGAHPSTLGRRQVSDTDRDAITQLHVMPLDDLVDRVGDRLGHARYLTKKAFYVDRRLELMARALDLAPKDLVDAIPDTALDVSLPKFARHLVSIALGICFDRFDLEALPGEPTEMPPLARLIDGSGVTWARGKRASSTLTVFVDDPGASNDIVEAIRTVLRTALSPRIPSVVEDIDESLPGGLRRYLAGDFFGEHLQRYSKSRRAGPIYLQLGVAPGRFSLWVRSDGLTRDSMFAQARDIVAPKLAYEERRRTATAQDAGPNPTAKARAELAAHDALVEELRLLSAELRRVAPLWNPDLDDGIVLVSAPLWRLVVHKPWQKELKSRWDDLVAGKYDWAHLAMHLWPERVVPKCAIDRSLAIAHGLEDVFWVEGADGKWAKRSHPTRPIDELVAERTSPAVKAALADLLAAPASVASGRRTKGE